MVYPKVLTESETIRLMQEGMSIARYGDGELKIAKGGAAVSQRADTSLAIRLREILVSDEDDCLIAIPKVDKLPTEKQAFWQKYSGPPWTDFYRPDKVYGSAFITRPDNAPHIANEEFFKRVRSIWNDRDVILINNDFERKFDGHHTMLENVRNLERWNCPAVNAWDEYTEVMTKARKYPKDTLFILAMGAAATVIAFDLSNLGYQALDLGHFGMMYRRFMNGEPIDKKKK